MSKSLKPVSARTIREAFLSGEVTVPDEALASVKEGARGRLHPLAVESYLDLNPKASYAEKSAAEVKTVTVPYVKLSKTGARLNRTVEMPISEVRKAAGVAGRRGRLSAKHLAKAGEAYAKTL